jgi:hypothetical protein
MAKPPEQYWNASEPFMDFKASHWVELLLTIALIGVGLSQLFVYWRQAKIMDKQAQISSDQNAISTSTQRAFVTAVELKIEARQQAGKNGVPSIAYWWLTPVVKNSGTTPTQGLRVVPIVSDFSDLVSEAWFARAQVSSAGVMGRVPMAGPQDPLDGVEVNRIDGTHLVLGPQAAAPIGGVGIPQSSLSKIDKVYVYGVATYRDIFPHSKEHVTKYCYVLGSTFGLSDLNKLTPPYGLCDHWNCADEECDADKIRYDQAVAKDEAAQLPPWPGVGEPVQPFVLSK